MTWPTGDFSLLGKVRTEEKENRHVVVLKVKTRKR